MSKILALDPGESTGWCIYEGKDKVLRGGTLPKNHLVLWDFLGREQPDVLVVESFKLYPGKAQSLYWNSFYPCEVIGVIKLWWQLNSRRRRSTNEFGDVIGDVRYNEQAPSVKKFAGGFGEDFYSMDLTGLKTEHVKDAYQHLKYFMRIKKEWI